LLKYQEKLFTFLHHDGVPWNNNNAEHAVKRFAYYRELTDGVFSETGLNNYLKSARNSGRDAPASFIDELLDLSERTLMAIVIQEEYLLEPHTSEDKGAGARPAFGGTDFEVTRLPKPLKEQLEGFAPIGKQLPVPGGGVLGQLLGGEQPAAVLGIERDEVSAAESRLAQQELHYGQLLRP